MKSVDHFDGKLVGLDLFSGIGGITEALSEWVRPVAYCENDRYAQGVLLSRMAKRQLPRAPIWDDVRTLRGSMLPAGIDIIYGGFPCTDISVANPNGRGLDGERSGLFFEIVRLVDEIRPRFVFLENVPEIVNDGLDRVLTEFAERRFDARWICLSAAEVGACHLRNRWWLLADSDGGRELQPQGSVCEVRRWPLHCNEKTLPGLGWPTVAPFLRTDDGIPNWRNRITALGGSVVPECAREAFQILMSEL